jgi:hypothetical protein
MLSGAKTLPRPCSVCLRKLTKSQCMDDTLIHQTTALRHRKGPKTFQTHHTT